MNIQFRNVIGGLLVILILIGLTIIVLNERDQSQRVESYDSIWMSRRLTFDGHEYLVFRSDHAFSVVHDPDCIGLKIK